MMLQATAFAHKCQIAWMDLVATGQNREAVVWGQIVEALFDNDPERAILLCLRANLPATTIFAIREKFQLTEPPKELY